MQQDQTLIDSLKRQLAERPDAIAYRNGERRLSYRDVEAHTNRLANALAAAGVARAPPGARRAQPHLDRLRVPRAAGALGGGAASSSSRILKKTPPTVGGQTPLT